MPIHLLTAMDAPFLGHDLPGTFFFFLLFHWSSPHVRSIPFGCGHLTRVKQNKQCPRIQNSGPKLCTCGQGTSRRSCRAGTTQAARGSGRTSSPSQTDVAPGGGGGLSAPGRAGYRVSAADRRGRDRVTKREREERTHGAGEDRPCATPDGPLLQPRQRAGLVDGVLRYGMSTQW